MHLIPCTVFFLLRNNFYEILEAFFSYCRKIIKCEVVGRVALKYQWRHVALDLLNLTFAQLG